MKRKTTTQRIRQLEKDTTLSFIIIGLVLIMLFVITWLSIPTDKEIEEQIDDTISGIITWECAENTTRPRVIQVVESLDECKLFTGSGRCLFEECALVNKTYCTREKPVLNPALEREVWYELQ